MALHTLGPLLDQIGQFSSCSGMPRKYSLYEAKSKLSELVRQVREGGRPITITLHGRLVADDDGLSALIVRADVREYEV